MSAVLDRERRVTAGKRMTFLAGQELENDETFWTHDTWQEDNESFHSSDAASSAEEDVFDSDFDESENDDDVIANEEMIGAAMEREIEQEERDGKKRSSSAYTEHSKPNGNKKKAFGGVNKLQGKSVAGAAVMGAGGSSRRWPSGPNGKRIIGDGLNAGIVLNVPPQYQKTYVPPPRIPPPLSIAPIQFLMVSSQQNVLSAEPVSTSTVVALHQEPTLSAELVPQVQVAVHVHSPVTTDAIIESNGANVPLTSAKAARIILEDPKATVSFQQIPTSVERKKRVSGPTLATTRVRRISHDNKNVIISNRSRKSITMTEKLNSPTTATNGLKRGKQAFTQEELLLEAVQVTEPANERWILGQKRNQAMKDDIETQLRNSNSLDKNTKVIEKFVSRRGYYNTITFPDMDHIPNILQRRRSLSSGTSDHKVAKQQKPLCIITGLVAKFRDPKTGHGYHNSAAFRELRRRFDANEISVCSTIVGTSKAVNVDTISSDADALLGVSTSHVAMKPKQRRSKATMNDTGTKRKAVLSGQNVARRKLKESNPTIRNAKDVVKQIPGSDGTGEMFSVGPIDMSSPQPRLRASSTGGESASSMILSSEVYDYEVVPHPNNSSSRTAKNGNHHNNADIAKIIIASKSVSTPPPSPERKSPRTPKPTIKILESARAITSSLFVQTQPQQLHLPSHTEIILDKNNNRCDADCTVTGATGTAITQPPSDSR